MCAQMDRMRFKRHSLPIGDDEIPLLVASEDGDPKAVFMSYESFLELAATLYTAIETLKTADIDADLLDDEDEGLAPRLRRVV